jgi:outer membrane protein assembly factor BamB
MGPLNCIALHTSSGMIATTNHRGKIYLFDAELAQLVKHFHTSFSKTIACLEFCVSGRNKRAGQRVGLLMYPMRQGNVLVFGNNRLGGIDITTGRVLWQTSDRHRVPLIRALSVNAELGRIVAGNYSRRIGVSEVEARQTDFAQDRSCYRLRR